MELTTGRRVTEWLLEDEEPFDSQYGMVTTEQWLRFEQMRLGAGHYIIYKLRTNSERRKMLLVNLPGVKVKQKMLSLSEVRHLPEPKGGKCDE